VRRLAVRGGAMKGGGRVGAGKVARWVGRSRADVVGTLLLLLVMLSRGVVLGVVLGRVDGVVGSAGCWKRLLSARKGCESQSFESF
jgi:hypothetical protein